MLKIVLFFLKPFEVKVLHDFFIKNILLNKKEAVRPEIKPDSQEAHTCYYLKEELKPAGIRSLHNLFCRLIYSQLLIR